MTLPERRVKLADLASVQIEGVANDKAAAATLVEILVDMLDPIASARPTASDLLKYRVFSFVEEDSSGEEQATPELNNREERQATHTVGPGPPSSSLIPPHPGIPFPTPFANNPHKPSEGSEYLSFSVNQSIPTNIDFSQHQTGASTFGSTASLQTLSTQIMHLQRGLNDALSLIAGGVSKIRMLETELAKLGDKVQTSESFDSCKRPAVHNLEQVTNHQPANDGLEKARTKECPTVSEEQPIRDLDRIRSTLADPQTEYLEADAPRSTDSVQENAKHTPNFSTLSPSTSSLKKRKMDTSYVNSVPKKSSPMGPEASDLD